MPSYAIIDKSTNKVINVIEWDGKEPYDHHKGHGRKPGELHVVQHNTAAIGHDYDPHTDEISNPNHNKGPA